MQVNCGTIEHPYMIDMTPARRQRAIEAMAETWEVLNRELAYSEDLRDHELVSAYRKHIQKLQGWLMA